MRAQGIHGEQAETMMSGRRSLGRDEEAWEGRRRRSRGISRRECLCGGGRKRRNEGVGERRSEED